MVRDLGKKVSRFQFALLVLTLAGVIFAGVALVSRPMVFTELDQEAIQIPRVEDLQNIDRDLHETIRQKVAQVERENVYGSAYLELSKVYYSNGLRQLAQQALFHYTQHCPEDAKAWYYLARSSHAMGDLAQSVEAYHRASQLQPDYPPAYWQLARVYLSQGNPTAALELAEKALRIAPRDECGNLLRALALLELGKAEGALRHLERSMLSFSVNREYADYLLAIARQRTQPDPRMGVFVESCQPVWTDPWEEELLKYATGFASRRVHAQQLYQKGNIDQAMELCLQLLKDNRCDAREWNLLGMCYFAKSMRDEAIEAIQNGLAKDPGNFNLHLNLANIYLVSAPLLFNVNAPIAREHFQAASALCPDQWEPYVGLGQIAHAQGQFEEALQHYEQACRLARSVQNCTWLRMYTLLDLGRFDEVSATLDRLPTNVLNTPHVRFLEAALMFKRGEADQARRLLEDLSKDGPVQDAELNRRIGHLRLGLADDR